MTYLIRNYSQMIPNGLLIFFPSYGTMNSMIDKWKKLKKNPKDRKDKTTLFEWMCEK